MCEIKDRGRGEEGNGGSTRRWQGEEGKKTGEQWKWGIGERLVPKIALSLTLLIATVVSGTVQAQECPELSDTVGSHSFRRIGETIEIPISLPGCQPIALEVHWSNGRNNGGLFNLTFLAGNERILYTKQISAFLSGRFEFPLTPVETLSASGVVSLMEVPVMVTIQAAPPFGLPATLSYRVERVNPHPRPRLRGIDANLAANLQTAPGRVWIDSANYTLTKIDFREATELEIGGKREAVDTAYRLMLKDTNLAAELHERIGRGIDLIWIDDAPLPVFRRGSDIGALIYDTTILRVGARVSVSNQDGIQMYELPDTLEFNSSGQRRTSNVKATDERSNDGDEGNAVVGIQNAGRVIGSIRHQLVQIQMTTDRPFPATNTALRLQVGKRFFINELSGDHTGRVLTLTLTPEMFGELRDGADIVAFLNRPDRSGSAGDNVWYFGRLNKKMLQARN